jgi:uncharacterized membrane protein (GlpM family)
MQLLLKVTLSVFIIVGATAIGRKVPSMAGLIGVMPLTGALVLVWMHIENRGDPAVMQSFARGALWGILPSILFFTVALVCLQKQLSLTLVLLFSFAIWVVAAAVHQLLLN